ncbi:MAG: alpha/beta fold hydrolase [Myxococcota bacterium]
MDAASRRHRLPPASRVRSGGQVLSVRRLGKGPRLVLLHGGPGLDHHVLLPLAERLAADFEVWLPDLPGHGASHEEGVRMPGLWQLEARLRRWLTHLDGGVDALLGHSLGAWLLRDMLRRGRVSPGAAVLLSPPAGRAPGGATPGTTAAREHLPRIDPERPDDVDAGRARLVEHVRAELGREPSAAFTRAVRRGLVREPLRYRALLRQYRKALARPTPRCRPPCPVLVLVGDRDRVTPPHEAATVAAASEGARLVSVADVGHYPWALDSGVVAEPIRRFLEESLPPR